MSTKPKTITLSGDDVDVLQRLSVVASKDDARPILNQIHVIDGLAFATDSYRLAFAEVDCDDCTIPAKSTAWLPLDGTTVRVREGRATDVVSWDVDGGEVGGFAAKWVDVQKAFLHVLARRPTRLGLVNPHKAPERVIDGPGGQALTLVGPRFGPYFLFDLSMVKSLLPMFDRDTLRIGAGESLSCPLWLWDDDTTAVVMGVRPHVGWQWNEAA